MSQLKSCVADVMDRIRRRHDADPGEFWHACLFWTFWVSLALCPIGKTIVDARVADAAEQAAAWRQASGQFRR